jgi:hypothetical protein
VIDLLGRPYRLGADGTDPDGALDCVHLVYEVRNRLGLTSPPFRADWYDLPTRTVLRDLLQWGERIKPPLYDGDVVLAPGATWMFGVAWETGLLIVSETSKKVRWTARANIPHCHCFRQRQLAAPYCHGNGS